VLRLPGATSQAGPSQATPAKSTRPAKPPEATSAAKQGTESHQGVANIAIICPVCGTRMYATSHQAGQTMICPDCLESVMVEPPTKPEPEPPQPVPPAPKNAPRQVPSPESGSQQEDDAEDFKLSEPIELPRARLIPKSIDDLLHAQPQPKSPTKKKSPSQPTSSDSLRDARVVEPPGENPPKEHREPQEKQPEDAQFAFKCQVCDTRMYATPDEIGYTKTCPDCYSEVLVKRPTKKVADKINVLEQEGDDFAIDAAADLAVYREKYGEGRDPNADPSTPVGLMEKARQAQLERERKEPKLPAKPLWTGVLRFLLEPGMIARSLMLILFLSIVIILPLQAIRWMAGDGTSQFTAVIAFVVTVVLLLFWYAYFSATSLFVLQQSADGHDRFEDWPDAEISEWIVEGVYVLAAIFYALAPGIGLGVLWNLAGGTITGRLWLAAISLFVMFPVVQLSLLEGTTLTSFLTRPIMVSLREHFGLWLIFYAETGCLVLLMVVLQLLLPLGVNVSTIMAATIWMFGVMIYFRLLGRLAWACQMQHLIDNEDDASQDEDENEVPN
jgi:DNA-directed RNA polymerase subunit M/transcription elongation factor TFIIS